MDILPICLFGQAQSAGGPKLWNFERIPIYHDQYLRKGIDLLAGTLTCSHLSPCYVICPPVFRRLWYYERYVALPVFRAVRYWRCGCDDVEIRLHIRYSSRPFGLQRLENVPFVVHHSMK